MNENNGLCQYFILLNSIVLFHSDNIILTMQRKSKDVFLVFIFIFQESIIIDLKTYFLFLILYLMYSFIMFLCLKIEINLLFKNSQNLSDEKK